MSNDTLKKQYVSTLNITDPEQSFEEVVKPVMAWLAKNYHPHTSIIIDATYAELIEGVRGFHTDEFIKD